MRAGVGVAPGSSRRSRQYPAPARALAAGQTGLGGQPGRDRRQQLRNQRRRHSARRGPRHEASAHAAIDARCTSSTLAARRTPSAPNALAQAIPGHVSSDASKRSLTAWMISTSTHDRVRRIAVQAGGLTPVRFDTGELTGQHALASVHSPTIEHVAVQPRDGYSPRSRDHLGQVADVPRWRSGARRSAAD